MKDKIGMDTSERSVQVRIEAGRNYYGIKAVLIQLELLVIPGLCYGLRNMATYESGGL